MKKWGLGKHFKKGTFACGGSDSLKILAPEKTLLQGKTYNRGNGRGWVGSKDRTPSQSKKQIEVNALSEGIWGWSGKKSRQRGKSYRAGGRRGGVRNEGAWPKRLNSRTEQLRLKNAGSRNGRVAGRVRK